MQLTAAQMAVMSRLLDEALPLDAAGRRSWLERLAPEYRDLESTLRQALLPADASSQSGRLATLPKIGAAEVTVSADGPAAGERVGPYQLVRLLGAGGMAQVWLAQRADGAFKRDVALKLPMLSRLRRDLAQRFAHERDILAGLEHVDIARFYDAGVSPDGLPYLVMEYVPGEQLTGWCDTHRLGVRERLTLFLQILDAVQYAHAHHVIHRDLKPSNILVTEAGQVRLLDFGVAKLLAEDEPSTQLTQIFGRALTPEYASPELLRGEPVDAASDIYSLGVVLYELLTGNRPYRIKAGASMLQLEQAVATADVERPSSHLAPQAALARACTQSQLARHLRGDLDAIVLKALSKDPPQRYATAAALADDLQRHLSGEPVEARPDTPLYRLGKFALRHRMGTTAATVATIAIVGVAGLAVTRPPAAVVPARSVPAAVVAPEKSIAVLPFVDMSEKKDQEYFSDGLAEELLDLLSRVPQLKVAARTSAFSFKGKSDDIPTIARKLLVANVLEGSVRKSGNRIRITAQLVRADNGYHVWSETYDRKLEDIFKIQDDIAQSVVQALVGSLFAESASRPARTHNSDGYNLYLQARTMYYRASTKADWENVIKYLQQTLNRTPGFAPAWALLSRARSFQVEWGYMPDRQGYEEARVAANRALELDSKLPEAHVAMAHLQLDNWDWGGSQAQVRQALDLDPGNSSALGWAALNEATMGRLDKAREFQIKAIESDPLNDSLYSSSAWTLFSMDKFAEAQDALRRALDLNPNEKGGHVLGGLLLLEQGYPVAALAEFERENDEQGRTFGHALAYHALARRADADSTLIEYEKKYAEIDAFGISCIHAYRGESDEAFKWLDRAYRQRDSDLFSIKTAVPLKKIRPDPRYRAFLRKLKLPE